MPADQQEAGREWTRGLSSEHVTRRFTENQMLEQYDDFQPQQRPISSVNRLASVANILNLSYGVKPANERFRWNLLWQFLVLLAVYPAFAVFGKPVCVGIGMTTFVLGCISSFFFFIGAVNCYIYMGKVGWFIKKDWRAKSLEHFGEEGTNAVRHIFVLPAYKEPIDVIMATLETVANQTIAHQITVCVTMEEKTPDVMQKKETLARAFEPKFGKFMATFHPREIEGFPEIPGACSNRNWGVRRVVKAMKDDGTLDPENTIITVCDSDTLFHPKYAENLTYNFLQHPDKQNVCYQSPLFYNIDLDKSYFWTRCTAIIRAFTMIGFLIPMNINTMSIYSVPLELLIKSKFFHPRYQMDDIIFTLSAMQAIGKRVAIRMIEVPTLSGPTSGANWCDELSEWYKQTQRWTIGAGEVFHYYLVKQLGGKFTFSAGLGYGFWLTYYYAYVLCAGGMVNIVHFITDTILSVAPDGTNFDECMANTWMGNHGAGFGWFKPSYFLLSTLVFNLVFFFGTAFALDCRIVCVLGVTESINPVRRIFHFIMAQFTLWAYCIVEYWSIFLLSVYGKEVCGHAPSKKDNLVKDVGNPATSTDSGEP